jgi:hypothetical protein
MNSSPRRCSSDRTAAACKSSSSISLTMRIARDIVRYQGRHRGRQKDGRLERSQNDFASFGRLSVRSDSLAERGEFELPVPICEQSDDTLR